MSGGDPVVGRDGVPRRVLVARHGERMDNVNPQWARFASRPHDPPLTKRGRAQARNLGLALGRCGGDADNSAWRPPQVLLSSPFIRCVQTADVIAETLGLGAGSICVEEGLCEQPAAMPTSSSYLCTDAQADSARYLLRAADLLAVSPRIRLTYQALRPVSLERAWAVREGVLGSHRPVESPGGSFVERCHQVAQRIAHAQLGVDTLVCVSHLATVEAIVKSLLGEARWREAREAWPWHSCEYTSCTALAWDERGWDGGWGLEGELFSVTHDPELSALRNWPCESEDKPGD